MPGREKLSEFTSWCQKHITGDETFRSGTAAQIFHDRLFQAFGQPSALDTAVLIAVAFNAKRDLLAQLLALNQEVAAKIEKGECVTVPGVPKNYPDSKKLVTEDRIKPPSYPPYEPPNPKSLRQPIPRQAAADAAHFYSAKEEGPPYRTKH